MLDKGHYARSAHATRSLSLFDDVRLPPQRRVCKHAGMKPGTIYPIFARLLEAGRVERRWEDIDPAEEAAHAVGCTASSPSARSPPARRLTSISLRCSGARRPCRVPSASRARVALLIDEIKGRVQQRTWRRGWPTRPPCSTSAFVFSSHAASAASAASASASGTGAVVIGVGLVVNSVAGPRRCRPRQRGRQRDRRPRHREARAQTALKPLSGRSTSPASDA